MSTNQVWVYCPRCRANYPRGYQICPRDREPLENTTVDPLLGAILDQRYCVEEVIGEGLLGRVYRARCLRVPRHCAIKVAADGWPVVVQATERLLNEAEAGGRMDHPNVVAVLDVGEIAPGQPYLVMELAEGETLRAHLARSHGLAVGAALSLALQLALGLEHAHGRGLVHRDLTPDNVIVGPRGRARILDFGLALVVDGDGRRLTGAGLVIGTPPYMSPEQAAGEPIDARADLYSLGVLLHQMVGGRAVHSIDDLIHRMTMRRPDDRIGSASAVVGELEALAALHTVAGPAWLPARTAPADDWADQPTARIAPFRG